MGARGRPSAVSLSIVPISALERTERPAPPDDLTVEQAVEWQQVVNRLAADWFTRETHGLLVQYCRHVVAARRVAQLIATTEAEPDLDTAEYDRLLKMQEREGRAMSALATRMRITQHSTYDKTKKKPKATPRPWEPT
jgi:hypothetical protein